MTDQNSPRGFGAAARITALAASVMDLHVRIALQEVDREKRRLIVGGLFLAIGGTAMFLALLAGKRRCCSGFRPSGIWIGCAHS